MAEFNNRISMQREIIKIVNQKGFHVELTGLSRKAINRWIVDNQITPNSEVVDFLFKISEKLFFLANKSQEQVSETYRQLSQDVSSLIEELVLALKN